MDALAGAVRHRFRLAATAPASAGRLPWRVAGEDGRRERLYRGQRRDGGVGRQAGRRRRHGARGRAVHRGERDCARGRAGLPHRRRTRRAAGVRSRGRRRSGGRRRRGASRQGDPAAQGERRRLPRQQEREVLAAGPDHRRRTRPRRGRVAEGRRRRQARSGKHRRRSGQPVRDAGGGRDSATPTARATTTSCSPGSASTPRRRR